MPAGKPGTIMRLTHGHDLNARPSTFDIPHDFFSKAVLSREDSRALRHVLQMEQADT